MGTPYVSSGYILGFNINTIYIVVIYGFLCFILNHWCDLVCLVLLFEKQIINLNIILVLYKQGAVGLTRQIYVPFMLLLT